MIIGKRALTLKTPQKTFRIEVRIFQPETDGIDWTCRYEIDWPSEQRVSEAAGFDSIQSLHLALQKIGIDLYMSDYHATGNLYWESPGNGYGFPVPKNGRDFLVGDDKRFEG